MEVASGATLSFGRGRLVFPVRGLFRGSEAGERNSGFWPPSVYQARTGPVCSQRDDKLPGGSPDPALDSPAWRREGAGSALSCEWGANALTLSTCLPAFTV